MQDGEIPEGVSEEEIAMTSRPPHPQPEQYYLVSESELQMIADQFKRGDNPFVAKRMGGIISDISSRPVSHSSPAAAPDCEKCRQVYLLKQNLKSLAEMLKEEREAAAKERERVLDTIFTQLAAVDSWGEKRGSYLIRDDDVKEILHNLRGEQPSEEKP